MYTIVYVSTAKTGITEGEIKDIFTTCEKNNNAKNISGIVIYKDGTFFQVLEIERKRKQVIEDLFEYIKTDPRHHTVIKILSKDADSQSFSKYHSNFHSMTNPSNIKELYKFLKIQKEKSPETHKHIEYLAQKFLSLI